MRFQVYLLEYKYEWSTFSVIVKSNFYVCNVCEGEKKRKEGGVIQYAMKGVSCLKIFMLGVND